MRRTPTPRPATTPAETGDRIGRWTLQIRLGAGAFGTAWSARDDQGRSAALKLLASPPGDEIRALARVCHPGVVRFVDGGGSPPFLAMELIDGKPLDQHLEAGALPADRALTLGSALLDAVAALHHAGVVHGDIKPANIVIDGARPVLVDFGLANAGRRGTLAWAAPEVLAGRASSAASDVYAVGLVLHAMLEGTVPAEQAGAFLAGRRAAAPQVENGPDWAKELVQTLLAVDPRHRPTADAAADLLAVHGYEPPQLDPSWLRARARSVTIPRPEVDGAIHRWLTDGGHLVLTGPSSSGRGLLLDQIRIEIMARGLAWVELDSSRSDPFRSIEEALADPTLPGTPTHIPPADPRERIVAAAAALAARGSIRVLVRDLDHAAPQVRAFVAALAHEGLDIAASATRAPSWAEGIALRPLTPFTTRTLVRALLGGTGDIEDLSARIFELTHGWPGPVVEATVEAVRSETCQRRHRSWVVDVGRLSTLTVPDPGALPELSPTQRDVATALALYGEPAEAGVVADLCGIHGAALTRALTSLADQDLIRTQAGRIHLRSRDLARRIAKQVPETTELHSRILERLEVENAPAARRLVHAVAAGAADRVQRLAPIAVEEALTRDPFEAANLAELAWEYAPSARLATLRVRALDADGRTEEAIAFGEPAARAYDVVELWVELGRTHSATLGDEEGVLRCVSRARAALDGPVPLQLVTLEVQGHMLAGAHAEAAKVAAQWDGSARRTDEGSWRVLRGLAAQALLAEGLLEEALARLAEVEPDTTTAQGAHLEAVRGRVLWHAGHVREAGAALARASNAEHVLPMLERARILNNAALAAFQTGDRPGAVDRWERALLLFERLGDEVEQVRVQTNLCVGYRQLGRYDRAEQAGLWAAERAASLELIDLQAMARGNVGDVALTRQRFSDAERAYDDAEQLARAHGLGPELVELSRRRAELAVQRRDGQASARVRVAREAAEAAGDVFESARIEALAAVVLAREGGPVSEVGGLVDRAIAPLKQAGAAGELADVRLWVAIAWLEAGDVRRALAEAERVALYSEEVGNVDLRTRADRVVAAVRVTSAAEVGDDRLLRMMELAVRVASQRDTEALLQSIAEAALDLLEANRAFVLLVEDGEPKVVAHLRKGSAPDHPPSLSIVRRALEDGREVLATDLSERADLRAAESVAVLGLRSALCVPLLDRGEPVGAIYVDSDQATERELGEAAWLMRALASHAAVALGNARALEASDRRVREAAEVAHDLRNPLSGVFLAARELADTNPDDPLTTEVCEDIVTAAQRMLSIVEGFLGSRVPSRVPLDLGQLVRRTCALFNHEARQKGVVLEAVVPGSTLGVIGQEDDLVRLLGNLIANALKYTAPGGTVQVTAEPTEEGGAQVTVGDEGPGIGVADLERIFERGTQGAGAAPGLGYGLSIARRMAVQHGGTLVADNRPGGGAALTLLLPRP